MVEGILIIAGILLLIVGFIGCVIPIPGVPCAWGALLLLYFVESSTITISRLVITAIVTIVVSVIDSIAPIFITKRTGGTKAGMIGSTVGIFVGMFGGLPGIIVCPLIGALIGELIHDNKNTTKALKSAFGSFLGFLFGTGLKLITCAVFTWIFITTLF